MNDGLPDGVPRRAPRFPTAVLAAVVGVEALAATAFAAAVLLDTGETGPSSAALVEAGSALGVGVGVIVLGVALARGRRWPAGAFAVVQLLTVVIGLSQTVPAVQSGRVLPAAYAIGAVVVAGAGLWALAALIRGPRPPAG